MGIFRGTLPSIRTNTARNLLPQRDYTATLPCSTISQVNGGLTADNNGFLICELWVVRGELRRYKRGQFWALGWITDPRL
ncbi:hypothetical protein ACLOJK_012437 [Asimina triloba]